LRRELEAIQPLLELGCCDGADGNLERGCEAAQPRFEILQIPRTGSQRLLAGEEFLDNLAGGPGRERGRVAFGEESDRLDEALSLASQQVNGLDVVGDSHLDGDAKWSEEFECSGMSGAIFGAEAGGIDFTTGEARNPFGSVLAASGRRRRRAGVA
jgi:hypothetical protein